MSARGRAAILAELGECVVDYHDDTGSCLLCETDSNGQHEHDCPVLKATHEIAALESEEL